jgi:type 1 glutamine amidotransferase
VPSRPAPARLARAALLLAALAFAAGSPPVQPLSAQGQGQAPLRIFLRGGPKTHGPAGNGLHDHEVWVKEWMPLLVSRGAAVEGDVTFPSSAQLDRCDVLVMFAANAGTILGDERARLEGFLKRGGGIVVLHDALVAGEDPHWFKTIVGGSWENKVAKYFEGDNAFYFVNPAHPVTAGASNFRIDDEVYWDLHMMPGAQILAVSTEPKRGARAAGPDAPAGLDRLIPQIWVYEHQLDGGRPYRAFVSLPGHHFSTFSSPHLRAIVLRGIAWAGRRDVDSLATPDEIAALR